MNTLRMHNFVLLNQFCQVNTLWGQESLGLICSTYLYTIHIQVKMPKNLGTYVLMPKPSNSQLNNRNFPFFSQRLRDNFSVSKNLVEIQKILM